MPLGNMFGAAQAGGISQKEYEQIRQDLGPYLGAGTGAIGNLSDPNKLMANFYASPNYQFTLQQGQNAINTDKATNGLLKSGGTLKAVQNYGSNLAAGQFNNYVGQQQFLANMGLGAEGTVANAGETNAQNQGNMWMQQGNNIDGLLGNLFGMF